MPRALLCDPKPNEFGKIFGIEGEGDFNHLGRFRGEQVLGSERHGCPRIGVCEIAALLQDIVEIRGFVVANEANELLRTLSLD